MNLRRTFAGLLLAAAGVAQAAAPQPLRFEQVFQADDGAAPLHYRASYAAGGTGHQLEVWVDHGTHLKRLTDQALELHAERVPDADEFHLTVLDLQRRIATRVDRTSLSRIGHFSDWFELAQGLRHPRGDYSIERATAPADAPQPVAACDWYALTQQGRTTRICWSAAARLPLLIEAGQGQLLWRVTEVDRQPIEARQFEVHDRGFVHNDANADIETD